MKKQLKKRTTQSKPRAPKAPNPIPQPHVLVSSYTANPLPSLDDCKKLVKQITDNLHNLERVQKRLKLDLANAENQLAYQTERAQDLFIAETIFRHNQISVGAPH